MNPCPLRIVKIKIPVMRKSVFVLFILSLLLSLPSFAQQDKEPSVKDQKVRERIFVGGFLGLQLGTQTAVNVSPLVGYRITNWLSAGLGGTYQYYNDRFLGESNVTHVYGYSFFTRVQIIPRAFIQGEYERLSLKSRVQDGAFIPGVRRWEENIFLGGGYRQPLSERATLNVMLLYNFNKESTAYYQNPIFRVGVDFRL